MKVYCGTQQISVTSMSVKAKKLKPVSDIRIFRVYTVEGNLGLTMCITRFDCEVYIDLHHFWVDFLLL